MSARVLPVRCYARSCAMREGACSVWGVLYPREDAHKRQGAGEVYRAPKRRDDGFDFQAVANDVNARKEAENRHGVGDG